MTDSALILTRRSLHAVAETVLAGPQYRRAGTIRLCVTPGGFRTLPQASPPTVAVRTTDLVVGEPGAERVLPLHGTIGGLAAAAGLELGAPEGLYDVAAAVSPDDELHIDPASAEQIAEALAFGDLALRRLDPGVAPVLWPEHFDVSTTVAEVNFGVSPGDTLIPEPYAYVAPWRRREGAFWDQPFGSAALVSELGDADRVLDYFRHGQELAALD